MLAEDPPKEEKARIKSEALLRDDNTIEAYEILQLNCELLSERIHLITHSKECPPDLVPSISTLIWASSIVDIPELLEIRKQFRYKFGKEFDADAMQNVGGVINDRVAAKLSVQPPSAYLVQTYLEKIADEHGVDWKPKVPLKADEISEPMAPPSGYSVQVGAGSGLNATTYGVEGGAGGLGSSAPPLSQVIPEAPQSKQQQQQQQQKQQSTYVSVLPTPSGPPSKIDDIEEEADIYVPGVGQKSNTDNGNDDEDDGDEEDSTNRARTQSAGEQSKDDGDVGGGEVESYDDLAARFAMLQK